MSSDPARASRVALGLALLLAVLLRAEYCRELILSPFGRHLLLDAEWYDQLARALATGDVDIDAAGAFRPPLYPLFLAALYRLFDGSVWAPRAAQWALGVVQVAVVWAIARRTHDERTAGLAALLAATAGMFVYFEGEILSTALGTFLAALAALLLVEADRRDSAPAWAGGGLAIGTAAAAHATALFAAPAAVLWALRARRPWVAATAVVVGVAIPVGSVALRNWRATGDLILLGTQGGINLYVGNNPHSDGKSALAPGFAEAAQVVRAGPYRDSMQVAARTLAERDVGRELSAAEVDRYWLGRALSWMRDHPKDALALLRDKTVFFWNGFEISNNRDLRDQARRFTPVLRLFLAQWGILLALGLFGMIRVGVRGRPRSLLPALMVSYSLGVIAFFVCARYRQPVVAWMLPFGAAGLLAAWEDLSRARERPRRAAITGLALVALFLATNGRVVTALGIADVTSERDAPFHRFNLAVLFERSGNLDRAIAEYRAAAATGVKDPRVHLNLGNTLARTGRAEEAREEYRRVLRLAPDYAAAVRGNLGILAAQQGDWNEAIRQFEECLRHDPSNANALNGVGAAYLSAGRYDEAIVAFRRALAARAGPEAALRRSLAAAYLEAGLVEDAAREAGTALRAAPDDVATLLLRGKIHTRLGEDSAAERVWTRARALAPGSPAVERAIAEARAERGGAD